MDESFDLNALDNDDYAFASQAVPVGEAVVSEEAEDELEELGWEEEEEELWVPSESEMAEVEREEADRRATALADLNNRLAAQERHLHLLRTTLRLKKEMEADPYSCKTRRPLSAQVLLSFGNTLFCCSLPVSDKRNLHQQRCYSGASDGEE